MICMMIAQVFLIYNLNIKLHFYSKLNKNYFNKAAVKQCLHKEKWLKLTDHFRETCLI